ncbi:MAG: ATP-binding cassette domain-containing protein, partial [Candidatus Promineifilaceae bacterium]
LRAAGLTARARKPVRALSRGMQQRLSLARATLHRPDVLLLDEPYTGLDAEAAGRLDALLRAEVEAGRTVLLVSHDLERALRLCDRVAVLSRGRIVGEATPDQLARADFGRLYAELTGRGAPAEARPA